MAKYRKKPVVIEAFQHTRGARWPPKWFDEAWDRKEVDSDPDTEIISIITPLGTMEANIGDWIIKGVEGELYPCKPDIFEMTYEPVE